MEKSHSWLKLKFDRLLSKSMWIQFMVLVGFLTVVLAILYIPFLCLSDAWLTLCADKQVYPWLMPLYLLIDSNALNNLYMGNENGLTTKQCVLLVFSCVIFLLGAIAFSGFIIGIITNSIGQRVVNHRQGHIHYLKSGHHIIMGYDDMVPSIITDIFEKDPKAFVLLMSAKEAEYIHEKLNKIFDAQQQKNIIINYGHRTSKEYYRDIHLEAAEAVYIVGQRSVPSHDAINVECVDSICAYLNQPEITSRPKSITCVFEDLDTYAAFKTSEIFGKVRALNIEFLPYNFYAGWAKQVFVKQYHKDIDRPDMKIPYPAVYGKGYSADSPDALTDKDTRYTHLVFVGTTNFAVAFAMEAANVLHFPNGNKVKTLITFIDLNADKEKDEFIVRNRHLFEVQSYYYCDLSVNGQYCDREKHRIDSSVYFTKEKGYDATDANFLDVEFEFIKGDVFSHNIQSIIGQWAMEHEKTQYLSIFLAMANQRQNFVLGMNMPDAVYSSQVPVFIRQDRSDNFVSNLRDTDAAIIRDDKKNCYYVVDNGVLKTTIQGGRYANIYPFGMNETAYSADDKSLRRAKLINFLYYTMSEDGTFLPLETLQAMPKEEIRKQANEYWSRLSVALRWSNLYNAYTIRIKMAFIRSMRGLALDDDIKDNEPISNSEAEVLARVEHNRWNVEKLLMGYRKAHKNEDKYLKENEAFSQTLKNNKQRFIHHDIRPYEQLDSVRELDKQFSAYLPWINKTAKEI